MPIFASCSFEIKSKRDSVWRQNKGNNPADINLQDSCYPMKPLRVFCLVGFSFFFYSPGELIPVSTKSKSILNCGPFKIPALWSTHNRRMQINDFTFKRLTRILLTGILGLCIQIKGI